MKFKMPKNQFKVYRQAEWLMGAMNEHGIAERPYFLFLFPEASGITIDRQKYISFSILNISFLIQFIIIFNLIQIECVNA